MLNNSASLNSSNTAGTTLSGGVEYGGPTLTLTFTNNYNAALTESGIIDDSIATLGASSGKLVRAGAVTGGVQPGTLVLTNANTYHGTTSVTAGILGVQNAQAFGVASSEQQTFSATSAGGGSFQLTYTVNGAAQTTAPLAFSGATPPSARRSKMP